MKRGSALLIVLGMLSFMVMSAVAFAMFMRQNRLPSSFLRQKIAASQLVKAGLARAMSEIDAAVGDSVYPGIGDNSMRNIWYHRILSPQFTTRDRNGQTKTVTALSPEDTAATLTLEGLAYIPPPLVNAARFWSRRSTTAGWQSLGYDAGRYAFTAINVSDYLDINRIRAGIMRDSSASNRVSMAYLFESAFPGDGVQRGDKFDRFLDQVANDTFATRFVSLADYNLALGASGSASGLVSPFYSFFEGGTSQGGLNFYGANERSAKAQKFVTDSWYPQPFDATILGALDGQYNVDIDDIDEGLDPLMKTSSSKGFTVIKNHLNLAERAALADYLDEDNVPTSLAMPTIERAPMLTGLQVVPFNVKPTFKMEEKDGPVIPKTKTEPEDKWIYRTWRLNDLGDGKFLFGGSAVFPFKRTSGLSEKTSYNAKFLVKFFLMDAANDAAFAKTRSDISYRPTKDSDWANRQNINEGWWSVVGDGKVSVKHGTTERDALATLVPNGSMDISSVFSLPADQGYVYGVKFRQSNPNDVQPLDVNDRALCFGGKSLKVRQLDGTLKDVMTLGSGATVRLTAMVWVRLMDGNDTVDMVPATIQDDVNYNGMPNPGVSTDLLGEYTQKEGVLPIIGQEILKFDGDENPFKDKTGDVTLTPDDVEGLRIYCCDPRYNWAPEDWFVAEKQTAISGEDWLNRIGGYLDGSNYYPHDIFQFVANQGYLQSMGEIDMLPLVRTSYEDFTYNESGNSSAVDGSFFRNPERYNDGRTLSHEAGNARKIDQTANRDYMWKQRWAFGNRAYQSILKREDPRTWGIVDSYSGAAVNPFGEVDIVKTALAYTPYDWIVTGEYFHEKNEKLSSGKNYCFCKDSSEAPLKEEDLTTIAQNLRAAVLNSGNNWEEDWGKWSGWESDNFFGANLSDTLHDVDRKFLCAYWRNCFANQQLYLVFVRAEPTVMGGATAKHTPSQLGGRAVALIWREAKSSVSASNSGSGAGSAVSLSRPHRMRILFYHQFN